MPKDLIAVRMAAWASAASTVPSCSALFERMRLMRQRLCYSYAWTWPEYRASPPLGGVQRDEAAQDALALGSDPICDMGGWIRLTGFMERRRSFRLDVSRPDHFRPFFGF